MIEFFDKMLGAIIVLNEPTKCYGDAEDNKKQDIKISMAAFQVFSGCLKVAGAIIIAASFSPPIFPLQQLITGLFMFVFGDSIFQATEKQLDRNGIHNFA